MSRLFVLFTISFVLSACAITQPLPDNSQVVAGRVVETISSSVTLSLRTAEKNLSGRGFMVYRRPDQMRLIILSPFGTSVMEAQLAGDRLTLVYPVDGVAYQGRINELPAATGQRGFAMLRWVLESDSPPGAPATGVLQRPGSRGGIEKVTLQDGLVIEKSLTSGEQVQYRNHAVLSGVRLPLVLQMENADGDRIRLVLEEPEINTVLEEQVFNVSLSGLRLLPLSQLKAR